MLKVHVIEPRELSPSLQTRWAGLTVGDPELESPCFRPEFTLAVAAECPDVEVAVLEDGPGRVGFFPYQRRRWNLGRPVGLKLCDMQGAIVHPETSFTTEELLRGCALRAWRFDHLLASQRPFAAHHCGRAESPYVDLREGFAGWRERCRRNGSGLLTQVLRKSRKLAREVGPLRFVAHTRERSAFELLLAWKAEQRRQSRTPNILAYPWAVRVLESIASASSPDFAGMLSALYAGEELVAVHFGMRSRSVLHYWFPAYNRRFGHYSPGLVLLVEMARWAADAGMARLDLGKGAEPYKRSLMSSALTLAEGLATSSFASARLSRISYRAREWLRSTPLARGPRRLLRRVYTWMLMR